MTIKISAPANDIQSALTLTTLPDGKTSFFGVLRIDVDLGGTVKISSKNGGNTGAVVASFKFPVVEGSGTVGVDAVEVIKFLKGYKGTVSLSYDESEGILVIEGQKKRSVIHVNAEIADVPPMPAMVNGEPQYRGQPCGLFAEVYAEDFADLIEEADKVNAKVFPLEFVNGNVKVTLTSGEAKANRIEANLPGKGRGNGTVTLGKDFVALFSNLKTGPVQLWAQEDPSKPVTVIHKDITYVFSPIFMGE